MPTEKASQQAQRMPLSELLTHRGGRFTQARQVEMAHRLIKLAAYIAKRYKELRAEGEACGGQRRESAFDKAAMLETVRQIIEVDE